jgi:hypothetical protein
MSVCNERGPRCSDDVLPYLLPTSHLSSLFFLSTHSSFTFVYTVMFQEISAALDHLVTLLHPSIDAAGFKLQVHRSLESRFSRLWFPETPARASASRVLLWHAHGGGEGLDADVRQACLDHVKEGRVADEDMFSSPFTLWIDPGCVAIRLGLGPGLCFTSGPSLLGSTRTIYTRQQQQQHYQTPPMLALIPSTPAMVSQGWSTEQMSRIAHHRSVSASSMTSSSVTGSRCTSQNGSYSSSAADDECPSLTVQDSDSELSIEDMIDSGCYKNFDIIDDADDDSNDNDSDVGDETITDANATPASIVNYDGGNVGVLGGGIRLGGAPAMNKPAKVMSSSPPALPSPTTLHGYEQSYGFPSVHQYPSTIEGYAVPMAKRIRSRGRRSRGRGAGRAARRQAAASEAIEQYPQSAAPHIQCEDERIMAIVRQRADQVAQRLVKRQSSMQNLHQQFYPQSQHSQQMQRPSQQQQYNQQRPYAMPTTHQLPIHPQYLHIYQSHATPLYQSLH